MPAAGQRRIGLRQPSAIAGAPTFPLAAGCSIKAFCGRAVRLLLFFGSRVSRKTTAPFCPIALLRLLPLVLTSLRFTLGLVVSMGVAVCVATQYWAGKPPGLVGSTITKFCRIPPC